MITVCRVQPIRAASACWERYVSEFPDRDEGWIELAKQGVGVHCGEGGTYHRTPHAVTLAWLRDALEILSGAGIGFALWNLDNLNIDF